MKKNVLSIHLWALAGILFLAAESKGWAHAFLDHSEPKVGSTITNAPFEIKLWFNQDVEPAFSSIKVQNASETEVDKKDTHRDAKNKALLVVSESPLPAGTYTVFWHVVSEDTHRTQGHFKFTIQPEKTK